MSYTLRLLTEEARDLVVEALRAEASKRTRVASAASLTVAADRVAKRDVRSASVRVTALLAEAAQLGQLADELAQAEDVPVVAPAERITLAVVPPGTLTGAEDLEAGTPVAVNADGEVTGPDDDGLSAAAHAAAELAGLEDTWIDPDGEDVDTGATVEDEPDEVEEVLKP